MAVEHSGSRRYLENFYPIGLARCPILDEERRAESDFAVEAARRLWYGANRECRMQGLGMTFLSIRLVAGDYKFVVLLLSAWGWSFLILGSDSLCGFCTGFLFVFPGRVE